MKKLLNIQPTTSLTIKETSTNDIAIIGIGLKLADYENHDDFWADLILAVDRIRTIPEQRRKDADAIIRFKGGMPGNIRYREMAYLDRIDEFDCRFFNISPKEAELMSPDQRLFMQTAWKALEDAGYGDAKLKGAKVGVFMGMGSANEYAELARQICRDDEIRALLSNVPSNTAARLSYILNWRGPALMVDTACSSSLVAVHLACRALRANECKLALAGTVKTVILPGEREKIEIESPDNRTRTFDDASAGTGAGEGVLAILLKPLERAIHDEDPIYAVIKGSAVNHDGSSAGMTVPNAEAQAELIDLAWKEARIDPQTVRFIEAHGTATRLGDTIEIEGITKAFVKYTDEKQFCAVGSVKSNFGHLDNAAGLIGLVKAALSLQKRKYPPLVHFNKPNRNIPFKDSPVFPAAELVELYDAKGVIRCGVSAFGLSGINCHLVMQEPPSIKRTINTPKRFHLFERKRHWFKLPSRPYEKDPGSFVFIRQQLAEMPDRIVYRAGLDHELDWLLNEHRIGGEPCMPGAAYFQLFMEAANKQGRNGVIEAENLLWENLLTITPEELRTSNNKTTIILEDKNKNLSLSIVRKQPNGVWTQYASARIKAAAQQKTNLLDIDEIKDRCIKKTKEGKTSPNTEQTLVNTGERWNCKKDIWENEKERLQLIRLHDDFKNDLDRFDYHPPMLDAALSSGLREPGFIPMSCGRARLYGPVTNEIYSYIKTPEIKSSEILTYDVVITNGDGKIIAEFNDLTFKRVQREWPLFDVTWIQEKTRISHTPEGLCVIGENESLKSPDTFEIPRTDDERLALIHRLEKLKPAGIIYAPPVQDRPCASLEDIDARLESGIYNLFRFVKSMINHKYPHMLQIVAVGNNTYPVTGKETFLHPENAALEGLTKVINRECDNIACKYIDIDESTTLRDIVSEFAGAFDSAPSVAFRNGVRYIKDYKQIQAIEPKIKIKDQGVYLITGGLGGIGIEIAKYLSGQNRVKLALIGRTGLPTRETWSETVKEESKEAGKIRSLLEIEQKGSEVLVLSADVSNPDQMEKAVSGVRENFGSIDGVIHCAGIAGQGFIFRKNDGDFINVLKPKVQGAWILDQITRRDDPDFFILSSSLTALTGAPGQSDYTAANSFLDAFSDFRNKEGGKTLSINWPPWKETGMAFDWGVDQTGYAVKTRDATSALNKLLSYDGPRAVMIPPGMHIKEILQYSDTNACSESVTVEKNNDVTLSGRDNGIYSDLEKTIAQVWCEVLGHREISIKDDYYELGGDSLDANKIRDKIGEKLNIKASIEDIFNYTTLEAYASFLETKHRPDQAPAQINPIGKHPFYEASAAQRRLYIIWELAKESTGYNLPCILYIKNRVDAAQLKTAFEKLIARHESLRTSFKMDEDRLVQVVPDHVDFVLTETIIHTSGIEAYARKYIKPFDLVKAPLIRAELVTLETGEKLLFIDVHHIAADALSLQIIFNELNLLYKNEDLPELKIQYKDFAHWQNRFFESKEFQSHEAYWLNQFEKDIPTLEFPYDFHRPSMITYEGAVTKFTVDKELFLKVRRFSAGNETTPFMVFLTAFFILFHKYSRQRDIIIAIAVLGRNIPEVQNMVGMFINHLAIRANPEADKSIKEFLEEVKQLTVNAYAHQDYPFDRLIQKLNLPRDMSREPLTGITFSYMNFEKTAPDMTGLRLRPYEGIVKDSSKFDISIFATEFDDSVVFAVEYYSALFSAETMELLGSRFLRTLEELAVREDATIGGIDFLLKGEREEILQGFNHNALELPTDKCIQELFEEQAEKRPDAAALIFNHSEMTYHELNSLANRTARYLKRMGVGPETIVGVYMERSLEMVTAVLGILKAGGAYLPLDIDFPKERLTFMIINAGASHLMTVSKLKENLPETKAKTVYIDKEILAKKPGEPDLENPVCETKPSNLACVMYTSGSTGEPKGTCVLQRSVVRLINNPNYASLQPDDVFIQMSPFAFDASTFEIWGSLLNGAALVILPPYKHSLGELGSFIKENKVSIIFITSGLFNLMIEENIGDLTTIGQLLTGGEVMSIRHAQKALDRLGDCRLIHVYGPTENTTFTTYCELRGTQIRGSASIGKPVTGTKVYILDAELQPVPVGMTGELYTGGAGLARGYLKRPDLTAAQFIPNPFASVPGERLYKTGDLARFLPNGNIEFIGRRDNQVKIRGFRIELDEVESNIRLHPTVRDTAVVIHKRNQREKLLAAYIVPGQGFDVTQLKAFLKNKLPDYMMPSAFKTIEKLPLKANGKVDRRRLSETLPDFSLPRENYEQPSTPEEEIVAQIWAEILHVQRVGRRDNFFELGGHSLLATQAISRMRNIFKMELPLRRLFESPTLEEFCRGILIGETRIESEELKPLERLGEFPLSFAQERLWFLDRLVPDSPFYNISRSLVLKGELKADILEKTLQALVNRHETLRTSFALDAKGNPLQIIEPELKLEIPIIDLTGFSGSQQYDEVKKLAKENEKKIFDLTKAPLIRASLVKLSKTEHLLLTTIHHIISDGWSIGVFNKEATALYNAYCSGKESPLSGLEIQYADFSTWQRRWLGKGIYDAQLKYWKKQLKGLPLLHLITDKPRPAVATYNGAIKEIEIPSDVTKALKELSLQSSTSLFMTLMAGLTVVFNRYTGLDDIVLGSPIANRVRRELEPLIGFFVNTLVMRCDLSGDPKFGELMNRVRKTALEAYENQDLPFEHLVEELQPERDMSRNPLVQVIFALQNAPMKEIDFDNVKIEPLRNETYMVRCDMEFHLFETGDSVKGYLLYNTDLFEASTIVRILSHYRNILKEAADNPHKKISAYEIIDSLEKGKLLFDWNRTETNYEKDKTIADLFEDQAARAPDAVALVYEKEQLTYKELDSESSKLAGYLQEIGVRPDVVVAICMERSFEMIIGVLGVLRAGGAYLPLDPEYPEQRLEYMLNDSGAGVLLTNSGLAGRLPAASAKKVYIDKIRVELEKRSAQNLVRNAALDNLAYVIYTSGSTGRPKGVMVGHRGLMSLLTSNMKAYHLEPDDRVLLFASFSFDASVCDIAFTLTKGASLQLISAEKLVPDENFIDLINDCSITYAGLTPSFLAALPQKETPSLKKIIVAGEACTRELAAKWSKGRTFINAYGPTESTVCAALTECEDNGKPPTIGKPIPNTQIYILDRNLDVVPIGVPGELHIGGESTARGYMNRPGLTAEKFIPNPFNHNPGARLYKTGDLARYLDDGNIEFLGRMDNQVKIRGFRIELGEIESLLSGLPEVQKSVVVDHKDSMGNKKLTAYVVPDYKGMESQAEKEEHRSDMVSEWRTIYDENYSRTAEMEKSLFTGWNSSYTGEPLDEKDMLQWVENTTSQILSLKPKNLLEIGCGLGLLLREIAPKCQTYVGTDFSKPVIDYLSNMLKKNTALSKVKLLNRGAHNFEGIEDESFDVIVLNSVVQYFPDADYLLKVLADSVKKLKPGGCLFIGDLRNYAMLKAFHASLQLFQAGPSTPLKELNHRIHENMRNEQELLIQPDFFHELIKEIPELNHLRIEPKFGNYNNELSRYRYDVFLWKNMDVSKKTEHPEWIDWKGMDITRIHDLLTSKKEKPVALKTITNSRTEEDDRILHGLAKAFEDETVIQLKRKATGVRNKGIEPDDLRQISKELSMSIEFQLNNDFSFDVVFIPKPLEGKVKYTPCFTEGYKPLKSRVNNPVHAKLIRQIAPKLRKRLSEKLPDYMIPSAFVLIDSIPLNPNGKIDKKALPDPGKRGISGGTEHIEPRNNIEKRLVEIWRSILGINKIGVKDNFFQSGGHSLLAVSLIARINKEFNTELPLAGIFKSPTIEDFTKQLGENQKPGKWTPLVPVRSGVSKTPLFCFYPAGGNVYSYKQLGDQLDHDQPFYVLQAYGLEKGQTPFNRIEDIVNYQLDWILSVQPQGPYFLSGWSLGGLLAFETAQTLLAMGHKIALLALFDSSARKPDEFFKLAKADNAGFMAGLYAEFLTLPVDKLRTMNEEEQNLYIVNELKQAGLVSDDFDYEQACRLFKVYKSNSKAVYQYNPRPYQGKVTLFRPVKKSLSAFQYTQSKTQGWGEFAVEGVDVHFVPGTHETMLKNPNVKVLADKLKQCMREAGR